MFGNRLQWTGTAGVLIATLALVPEAPAERLGVGHEDVDAGFIEPYEADFDFLVASAHAVPAAAGRWTDRVEFFDRDGSTYLRRKVVRYPAGARTPDLERVMIAHAVTLAPVATHQAGGSNLDVLYALHFDGTKLAASLANSAAHEIRNLSLELEEAPFDLSLWATLAMSIPFEAGYVAELPVVDVAGGGRLRTETLTVIGPETVAAADGSYATWMIAAEPSTWKFWVRKEPPYIVRIEHPVPGAPDQRAVSILKEWR